MGTDSAFSQSPKCSIMADTISCHCVSLFVCQNDGTALRQNSSSEKSDLL